jgi:hypothetical protein
MPYRRLPLIGCAAHPGRGLRCAGFRFRHGGAPGGPGGDYRRVWFLRMALALGRPAKAQILPIALSTNVLVTFKRRKTK